MTHGPTPVAPAERVLRRVARVGDCWLWTGAVKSTGYAQVTVGSLTDGTRRGGQLAHRVVYEALVGRIPAEHDLHHTCGVRHCVNPAHLEPIRRAEHGARHSAEGHDARWGR